MTDKIIEITPELNRRVQGERRAEPRAKIARLERELEMARAMLNMLRRPYDMVPCWCPNDRAQVHPAVRNHSDICHAVRYFLTPDADISQGPKQPEGL